MNIGRCLFIHIKSRISISEYIILILNGNHVFLNQYGIIGTVINLNIVCS